MKRKNKILLIALLSILIIAIFIFVFGYNNYPIQPMYEYENLNLSRINGSILMYSGDNLDWDEYIREIGNIVYNPELDEYLFFYSGYNGEYKQNNVFVGMASSKDGINWIKYGRVLNLSAEDPYIIYYDNTFYMFFEDKEEVPFRRISLATSQDGRNWEIVKRGVLNPSLIGWQSQDVSSPVVLRYDNNWIMLYEGRGFFNKGKIGYATSNDLINWNRKCFSIFSGGSYWDDHVVPDDIIQYNNAYIMTYHGYHKEIEEWQSGLAISNNLMNWETLTKDPISKTESVMFFENDLHLYFISQNDTIVKYWIFLS